jgi:DNA-directed RNA polymerase specialized sigma54-like protein
MVFMCHLKALVRVYEVSAMKFSQRLEIRQGQSLVMTPQLLQAIKLLQLPTLDLAQFIEQELESNPLLERVNDDDGPDNAAGTYLSTCNGLAVIKSSISDCICSATKSS